MKMTKKQSKSAAKFVSSLKKEGLGSVESSDNIKIKCYSNPYFPGLFMKVEELRIIGEDVGYVAEYFKVDTDGNLISNPEKELLGQKKVDFLLNMKEVDI